MKKNTPTWVLSTCTWVSKMQKNLVECLLRLRRKQLRPLLHRSNSSSQKRLTVKFWALRHQDLLLLQVSVFQQPLLKSTHPVVIWNIIPHCICLCSSSNIYFPHRASADTEFPGHASKDHNALGGPQHYNPKHPWQEDSYLPPQDSQQGKLTVFLNLF